MGTDGSYNTSLERFVRVLQELGAARGIAVLREEILPSNPRAPVSPSLVVAFIHASVMAFATSTVSGTLSAIRAFCLARSNGRDVGPTGGWVVRRAMQALRRQHAGTTRGAARAAFAMPLPVLELLQRQLLCAAAAALAAGHIALAYRIARDLVFYVIAFVAVLRKSETLFCYSQISQRAAVGGTGTQG